MHQILSTPVDTGEPQAAQEDLQVILLQPKQRHGDTVGIENRCEQARVRRCEEFLNT